MRDKLINLIRRVKAAFARRWAEFVASQKTCNTCAHRSKTDADPPCNRCFGCDEWEAPKTNADKIRAMTDEELVVFLDKFSRRCMECNEEDGISEDCPIYKEGHYCHPRDIMNWLKQLAEVET